MERPSLSDLTAFIAVASHRSFRRAADELGTAPSTLSHIVRALEERLGVRLLNRTTRSVSPTEAGRVLLLRLQPVIADLDQALLGVAQFRGNVAGTVRINAPRVAATLLVERVLPRLAERYPHVSVDLVVEGKLIDIVANGFDAGVRLMDQVPKDMIAGPLLRDVRYACVAAPDYLARSGTPLVPDDLRSHHCIGHRMPSGKLYAWEFEQGTQQYVLDTSQGPILDDEELMIAAAIRGLGIAYVPLPVAQAAITRGELSTLLDDWMPPAETLAIYYPGHRSVPPALRAVLDIARETAAL